MRRRRCGTGADERVSQGARRADAIRPRQLTYTNCKLDAAKLNFTGALMARPTASCIVLSCLSPALPASCRLRQQRAAPFPSNSIKDDAEPAAAEYIIGVGDMLSIQVWDQPADVGHDARCARDGRISLPLRQRRAGGRKDADASWPPISKRA